MNNKGFSVFEIVIVAACLALMMLAVGSVISVGQSNYSAGMTISSIQDNAESVVNRIANEVQQSSSSTFFPVPNNTDNLTFQKCIGYTGGAIQWGNAISYAFQYETGEIDDGADNNGNGLIDEGRIVRTENGQTVTITCWAREGAFLFSLNGNVLTIELTLERRDSQSRIHDAVVATSVALKN